MENDNAYSDKVALSGSGEPVTPEHREIDLLTGQQKGYIVLTAEERAKGFVRPVRSSYRHVLCGAVTTMGLDIAETYARDPEFYGGTFCTKCRAHYPLVDSTGRRAFTWEPDGSAVGS